MKQDPWHILRRYTQARIAQGRAGCSLPSAALLDFQLAHAAARDAVHQSWDVADFAGRLQAAGLETCILRTRIDSRVEYLQRPDKGRRLQAASAERLQAVVGNGCDVAVIVSNGLSSTAVNSHGLALLAEVVSVLRGRGLALGPICLVADARVAVADEIGALLKARASLILIGERPGLSAADSLGGYLTYGPKIGNTDAQRNCLSNIRSPEGLSCQAAAAKLGYLLTESLRRGVSGIALKDDMPPVLSDQP
ncbi:MAG: ethanolamine ammonia-lyase subunit EutC [Methylococcales bacterium]|nr:ethanolamine ammonia-lyase subunit EutC [Methylococcales bacterium]